ncbi:subtilisin-like protein [Stipitochalara longipes BDJ]|nr:subtilisin-like protein [Stipitochalara longipes BDJ]
MLLKIFCSVLLLVPLSFSFPGNAKNSDRDVLFKSSTREKLAGPPLGWVKDESANIDKNSMMTLRIHLTHQNMDKFHELATNLYGSHLSQEVINSMIAPKDESRDLVLQWLNNEGLGDYSSISPRADSIIIQASISQIEKLLDAEYSSFVRIDSRQSVVRTLEYSIPGLLKSHVDMVQPTTFFGLRPQRSGARILKPNTLETELEIVTGCVGTIVTPECLSNLYNFKGAKNYTNGLMGIAGFLEEYPSPSDLASFMTLFVKGGNEHQTYSCIELHNGTATGNTTCGISGVGPDRNNPPDYSEANLDAQYARAITQAIPNVYYSTAGRPPWLGGAGENTNEPYLDFLDILLNLTAASLPNTISISYGDDESTVPLDYATTVCNLFAQLGARGVSILVASGDSGVGGSTCSVNGKAQFTTAFPASCPWVTAVGGTQLATSQSKYNETAWDGSGGGFSEVFKRPSYQNATISNWLTDDKTHQAVNLYFNQSGRAYPDVSAQSYGFQVVINNKTNTIYGTSCASPTFASIIQLLNSDRLANGKSGLGFLNPWLYSNATAGLMDITNGANSGCGGTIGPSRVIAGFQAVPGWDPVTGLGTPNFESLLKISSAT